MGKFLVACCSAILLSTVISLGADAVPNDSDLDMKAASASSVSEFLAICSKNRTPCYNAMAIVLLDAADEFCLPQRLLNDDTDYKPVLDWLSEHSETHSMHTEPALIMEFKALYPCQK